MQLAAAFVLLVVIPAYICFRMARSRGAAAAKWIALAVLIGPFAIPIAYFAIKK